MSLSPGKLKVVLPVSIVATVAALIPAGAANASPLTSNASGTSGAAIAPMHTVFAQSLVSGPDSAGNVQVLLEDGQTVSVPSKLANLVLHAHRPAASGPQPNAVVSGDCGFSYVDLGHRPDGTPVYMYTGFHTNTPSIAYNWNVGISGPPNSGYQYNYTASGDLFFRNNWRGSHTSGRAYPGGFYTAAVSSNYSFSILETGSICTSGGPVQTSDL